LIAILYGGEKMETTVEIIVKIIVSHDPKMIEDIILKEVSELTHAPLMEE